MTSPHDIHDHHCCAITQALAGLLLLMASPAGWALTRLSVTLNPAATLPTTMQPTSDLSVRHYGPSRGSHAHEHFQILWNLSGELELDIEGRGQRLVAGSGVLIAPQERHDFESRGGSRWLVLDSTDTLWAARPRATPHAGATDHLARFLGQALQDHLPISHGQGALLLGQAWGGLDTARRPRRQIDWDGLRQWAQARLAAPLGAADLARQASLGESQFRARCQEATGDSPMRWLRQLRLEHARQLRASGLSVAEAARRVGYGSPVALATALRRRGR